MGQRDNIPRIDVSVISYVLSSSSCPPATDASMSSSPPLPLTPRQLAPPSVHGRSDLLWMNLSLNVRPE